MQMALPAHRENKSQEIHSAGCSSPAKLGGFCSAIKFLSHFFYLNWEMLHRISVNVRQEQGKST